MNWAAASTWVAKLSFTDGVNVYDQAAFQGLLREELRHLEVYNCRLTEEWIRQRRPGL